MSIPDLIQRLETAAGPDREIDAQLQRLAGDQALLRGGLGWEWRKDGKGVWSNLPSPTASLDAAVALGGRLGAAPAYVLWPALVGCDPHATADELARRGLLALLRTKLALDVRS